MGLCKDSRENTKDTSWEWLTSLNHLIFVCYPFTEKLLIKIGITNLALGQYFLYISYMSSVILHVHHRFLFLKLCFLSQKCKFDGVSLPVCKSVTYIFKRLTFQVS